MSEKRIIMSYTAPPSLDDLVEMAGDIIDNLPEELLESTEDLVIEIEEFPDEVMEQELDLEDPYELLALYRGKGEIAPGVERKIADGEDTLVLFRRPILDMWCESGDDLNNVLKHVIVEELGKKCDFSEDEIDDMAERLCAAAF